jgi:thermolysin
MRYSASRVSSRPALPAALLLLLAPAAATAQARALAVAATAREDTRAWAERIERLGRAGELTLSRVQRDPDFADRLHARLDQRLKGVRVFGAQLAQQVAASGETLTVFGRLYEGLDLETQPALTPEQAARIAAGDLGRGADAVGDVELVVLTLVEPPVLAYTLWTRLDAQLVRTFVDARSGAVAMRYLDTHTASVVGAGTGVHGDRKKVSADSSAGSFRADDKLRPPLLTTYDMRFNVGALNRVLATGSVDPSFVASDADNNWTDGGVVDAHVYTGYTYDYYWRRHGRRGIDGQDLAVRSFIHFDAGYVNAFWSPLARSMFYGDGGSSYVPFSGGLDVVAHELTHGVTQFTWNGIYTFESGALNEAFSDIMGASVEFFHEPPGEGRQRADYWLGEDLSRVFNPAVFAFRSMENPSLRCRSFGCDPDHYNRRLILPLSTDNGGVHINSGIANQAFYLLVEGGTNRTSGLRVAGLGAANRERAEKIFHRGFTSYMTPSSSFAAARAATLQAARDLYGADSNEAAQVAAAWTAVGVN